MNKGDFAQVTGQRNGWNGHSYRKQGRQGNVLPRHCKRDLQDLAGQLPVPARLPVHPAHAKPKAPEEFNFVARLNDLRVG